MTASDYLNARERADQQAVLAGAEVLQETGFPFRRTPTTARTHRQTYCAKAFDVTRPAASANVPPLVALGSLEAGPTHLDRIEDLPACRGAVGARRALCIDGVDHFHSAAHTPW